VRDIFLMYLKFMFTIPSSWYKFFVIMIFIPFIDFKERC
jgi:hypothetical protein